ncbi:DUF4905 domain-containing protein [Chryseolinea lacunae]|uniref:DUF4905 domain-containing protein n=1 Tax=Chryseolinea lacunae TaxID=2801331 RepID=A0ABS1KUB7_9BACT|nr:DUF4905 domain-containing protein [Chryseolinea lacunae]MBL0742812.1 DUF4905 domain-containing protein [Chryseolinea lacunae]
MHKIKDLNRLGRSIEFNFSHVFDGVIWNTSVSENSEIMVLEVRRHDVQQVSFSALETRTGRQLWKNLTFDEPWWISLAAVTNHTVIFTLYLETNNPDRKGIMAYDLFEKKIMWFHNDFALTTVGNGQVRGMASKHGVREVVLAVATGQEVKPLADIAEPEKTEVAHRPHQYPADHAYFHTVKTFLETTFNLSPVVALEYLEHDSLIFISFYLGEKELANHLLVLSDGGEVVLKEKLDEALKGIGLDTFFLLAGSVFFVKNRVELDSYKIV